MIQPKQHRGKAKSIPADPKRVLLPFQEKWRADRSRIKLCEKSRQIGWTWSDALDTMEQAAAGVCDVWISSRDELQAKLYLDDVQFWSSLYSKGGKALGLQQIVNDDGSQHSAYVARFPSGSTVNSLSSNPDAQAGKRGTRKLDEFALHKDPRRLYDIAYPGITWGGQLAIFSTHRGKQNFFNQLIEEIKYDGNPKSISLHTVRLEDALAEGLLYKLQQRLPDGHPVLEMDEDAYFDYTRAGCASPEAFLQEYCCVPADDASAFIPYELIDACCYSGGESWEYTLRQIADSGNDFYLGVDVGRSRDLTVMWLIERTGGISFTRKLITLQDIPFSEQERHLYELLDLPNVRRCCIDSTGLGMQFAERAQQRYGKYRVEAVRFSAQVKEQIAYPVRKAFEDRSLRIPRTKEVEADIRKVRKETTTAGNIRFTAEADKDGHADRFWALALALHAVGTQGNPGRPFLIGGSEPVGGRSHAILHQHSTRAAARRVRGMIG